MSFNDFGMHDKGKVNEWFGAELLGRRTLLRREWRILACLTLCGFLVIPLSLKSQQIGLSVGNVCPGEQKTYQLLFDGFVINCLGGGAAAEWTVTNGTIMGSNGGPNFTTTFDIGNGAADHSITILWSNNSSNGSIAVSFYSISGPCGVDVYTTFSTIPKINVPEPQAISFSKNNVCPAEVILLTANTPASAYPFQFVWEININNAGWTSLTSTTSTTINYTVPSIALNTADFHRIKFRFYTLSSICSGLRSVGTIQTGDLFVYPPAPTMTITPENKICTNSITGGLRITSPTTYYPEVKFNISGPPNSNPIIISSTLSGKLINLPPGTYFVQAVNFSSTDPQVEQCASPTFGPFTIGTTNTPLSISPSISSNALYNGRAVKCFNDANGQVTLTPSGGTAPLSYSKDGTNFQASPIFSGLSPTNYTFTIKDANGCTNTAAIGLPNTPDITFSSPIVSNYNGYGVSCQAGAGSSDGQIAFTVTGGTPAYGYVWKNSSNVTVGSSATLSSVVPAGSYSLTVTDINGCPKTSSSVPISAPPALTAGLLSSTNPTCNGGTGQINLASATGTGSVTYSVSPSLPSSPQPVGTPITLVPANILYTVTIKDANNCTAPAGTVTLSQPAAIGVSNAIVSPSCFGGNNGSITVTATNGVGALQYSRDGGSTFQTSNVFNTGISSGAYSIVVKDANGCLSPTTIAVVSQPSAVAGTIATPPPFTCFNTGNSANLNLTPSGGTAGYTFLWSTGATTEDISITLGLSLSSNYSVTITDSKGCTANRSITVTQPSQLTSTAISTNVTCSGANNGTVNLTPLGGTAPYSFLWNTGATTEDLGGRTAGTYSVTVTDFNGCTSFAFVSITEPAALVLTQGVTSNVSCNGLSNGSINLVASGGTGAFEYSKDGIVWQSSSLISGLAASAYTLRLRDQNNCTAQLNVTITQPSVLSVSVSNIINAACGQANGSAQSAGAGGTGNYTFAWRNSLNQIVSTNASLTNVTGGIYRVTITDQNGCTDFKDAAISSPNGPVAAINSVIGTSCANTNDGRASISVSSGQPPYTIVWNNGEIGLAPVALKPGTGINIVTITDASGCATAQVVDVPSPPVLTVKTQTNQSPTCPDGVNGSAQVLAQGGTGPYTYSWSTGVTGATLSNVFAGAYQVTAKDSKNCTAVLSVTIADKPAIVANTNQIAPSCIGKTDGSISISATGGNGSFSYLWNTGATSSSIANIGAGTYSVAVTDALGCSKQSQIILAEPPPLSLDLGPDKKICVGGSVTLSSPVSATSYSWTSTNGFTSNSKQVTLTQAGDYKLRVTNANGCIAEDNFALTTATDLLNADFLMTPVAHVGDTVVVIDITWPLPDGISWTLPSSTTLIEQTADYVSLVFNEEGKFPVRLTANLAQCQDEYSASIEILKRGESTGGGTSGNGLIKSLTAFPNPTSENRINLKIELNEVAPVRIRLVSLEGNIIVTDFNADAKDLHEFEIRLDGVTKGVYFLLVDVRDQKRVVRIVVI